MVAGSIAKSEVRAPRRTRTFWRRVVAVCLGTLLAVGGLEVALRVSVPYHFDRDWILATLPGRYHYRNSQSDVLIEVNCYGLIGPDFSLKKPKGVVRILALGDSTTWGEGVAFAQTYPKFSEATLNRTDAQQRSFEFVNVSRPGAGVQDYLRLWKRVGRKFEPDVVVIGFFIGNDPFSVINPYLVDSKSVADAKTTDWTEWLSSRLAHRLSAARTLLPWDSTPVDMFDHWLGAKEGRLETHPMSEALLLACGAAEGVSHAQILDRLARIPDELRSQAWDCQIDPWLLAAAVVRPQSIRDSQELTPDVRSSWRACLSVLDECIQSIRQTGATPVVLAIPRATQVGTRYVTQFRKIGFDLTEELAHSQAPQQYLRRHLDDAGVAFVNPIAELREFERRGQEQTYFDHDIHLTGAGNRILGSVLAQYLLTVVLD